MSRFLESIKIKNGVALLIGLHQDRVDRSLNRFVPEMEVNLKEIVKSTELPMQGIFKLRVVYGKGISTTQSLTPYLPPVFNKFVLREVPELSYSYKFLDRTVLESHQPNTSTQVLFTQNGFLTDSIFSNLIFSDGTGWWTPRMCLLAGIMRRKMLMDGTIKEADIHLTDLPRFTHFRLINALNGLDSTLIYPVEMLLDNS